MVRDLIIIGGGAAGLVSSIMSKDLGLDVEILEGTDRVGRKILTTGNGRCNISNVNIDISRYHSNKINFGNKILHDFSTKDTIYFFSSIGLPLCTLENNKMFPLSLQSSSVLDILRLAIEERNIPINLNCKVKEIKFKKNIFYIFTENEIFKSKNILLCTGGKSYPKTGSDGSGYNLAKSLGHNIITPLPSLVQIKLNHNKLKALSGIKLDGSAEIFVDTNSIKKTYGEILFTDYGISGPPILQLSRIASINTFENKKVNLIIDLFPSISLNDLKNLLQNHWGTFSYRSIHNSLIGIINKKLIPIILKESKIDDIHKECYNLTWDEKENLFKILKSWNFEVSGTNSFKDAQVTAGGINTAEVNDETLESKFIPGLFFAGEILDIDGDCGGFNLQWAWSSAAISTKNIYNKIKRK